jgi:hypothetical protein
MFYDPTMFEDGWFECPRCMGTSDDPLCVVPIALKPLERNPHQHLCGVCFRAVFGQEPPYQYSREVLRTQVQRQANRARATPP